MNKYQELDIEIIHETNATVFGLNAGSFNAKKNGIVHISSSNNKNININLIFIAKV
ncbi:MAG: hypothetical protein M0Q53_04530 [Prolixibacteraceae bacterium]|jgi:hypothetical protein|nr:hypothetical protein [Prolixibacteraceae bacterium]